jgi:hypothetical protein
MQRNVPQFIEIEDKIFGPFTLKQFGFLMGGFGLCVIIWRSVPFSFGVFLMGPVIGLALVLAFGKYNTKPFIDIIRAGLVYVFGRKDFRWQSPSERAVQERYATAKKEQDRINTNLANAPQTKTFSANDIKNLAKQLDNK